MSTSIEAATPAAATIACRRVAHNVSGAAEAGAAGAAGSPVDSFDAGVSSEAGRKGEKALGAGWAAGYVVGPKRCDPFRAALMRGS